MICSYVFDELPKIYKLVTENKPLKIETSSKTKKSSLVSCDQCKFKSSIIQMKMHIKTIHDSTRPRVNKRASNFTPIIKAHKKVKKSTPPRSNIFFNTEGIMDESLLMLDNTFGGKEPDVTVEENIVTCLNTMPEMENYKIAEIVLYTCDKCENDFETESLEGSPSKCSDRH